MLDWVLFLNLYTGNCILKYTHSVFLVWEEEKNYFMAMLISFMIRFKVRVTRRVTLQGPKHLVLRPLTARGKSSLSPRRCALQAEETVSALSTWRLLMGAALYLALTLCQARSEVPCTSELFNPCCISVK